MQLVREVMRVIITVLVRVLIRIMSGRMVPGHSFVAHYMLHLAFAGWSRAGDAVLEECGRKAAHL